MTSLASFLMGYGFMHGLNTIILPLITDTKITTRNVGIAVVAQFVASLLWAIAYHRNSHKLYRLETEVLISKMMPGKWVVKQ